MGMVFTWPHLLIECKAVASLAFFDIIAYLNILHYWYTMPNSVIVSLEINYTEIRNGQN